MAITPEQCRAARALAKVPRDLLAAEARLSLEAITAFEAGSPMPRRRKRCVVPSKGSASSSCRRKMDGASASA